MSDYYWLTRCPVDLPRDEAERRLANVTAKSLLNAADLNWFCFTEGFEDVTKAEAAARANAARALDIAYGEEADDAMLWKFDERDWVIAGGHEDDDNAPLIAFLADLEVTYDHWDWPR